MEYARFDVPNHESDGASALTLGMMEAHENLGKLEDALDAWAEQLRKRGQELARIFIDEREKRRAEGGYAPLSCRARHHFNSFCLEWRGEHRRDGKRYYKPIPRTPDGAGYPYQLLHEQARPSMVPLVTQLEMKMRVIRRLYAETIRVREVLRLVSVNLGKISIGKTPRPLKVRKRRNDVADAV
jgi:hypothetical protein